MSEMKKCPHCGAIQNPSRQTCVDCGKVLPEAREEFANELDMIASSTLDGKMEYDDKTSPFYKFKRVLVIAAAVLLIADLVLFFIYNRTLDTSTVTISIICAALSMLTMLFPRHMSWILRSRRYYRAPLTSPETDYVDSGERMIMLVLAVLLLVGAIGTTAYFSIEKPTVRERGGFTATFTDQSGETVELTFNQ